MPSLTADTYVSPDITVAATIAALRLVDVRLADNQLALLTDSLAGGTAAWYIFDSANVQADNGGTIVKPASLTTGRWLRCGGTL